MHIHCYPMHFSSLPTRALCVNTTVAIFFHLDLSLPPSQYQVQVSQNHMGGLWIKDVSFSLTLLQSSVTQTCNGHRNAIKTVIFQTSASPLLNISLQCTLKVQSRFCFSHLYLFLSLENSCNEATNSDHMIGLHSCKQLTALTVQWKYNCAVN